jgi:hypothetical protein
VTTALDNIIEQFRPRLIFGLFSDDTIYIQLSSDSDPAGKCIASVHIVWKPYFACGSLAPHLELEGGDLKFIAMFPEILGVFLNMKHQAITMKEVLAGIGRFAQRCDLWHGSETACEIDQREQAERELEIEKSLAERKLKAQKCIGEMI